MGLEAGWNCHICLRSEHSTDVSAAVPGTGTELSLGYTSMLGSVKIDSLSDIRVTSTQNSVPHDWQSSAELSRKCRVRCSSAPDTMLIHSANDRRHKSIASYDKQSDDVAPARSWELTHDDDNVDQRMPLMLPQLKPDVAIRHWQVYERSMSMHEPRRRSASVRSASLNSADRHPRSVVTNRATNADQLVTSRAAHVDQLGSTVAELNDERTRALLEEDTAEKLNRDEIDDAASVASYIISRRSSYTESLPPGLGNRVCASSYTVTQKMTQTGAVLDENIWRAMVRS